MGIDVGVLTLTCLVLAGGAVRAAVRLGVGAPASRLRGVVALVAWSLLLVAAGYVELRHHATQAAVTDVTRWASDRSDVHVSCRRVAEGLPLRNARFTSWDRRDHRTVSFPSATCAALGDWRWTTRGPGDPDQVAAVHAVGYHAVRVAGVPYPGLVECLARDLDRAVARRLGAGPAQADSVASAYREMVPGLEDHLAQLDCSDLDTDDVPTHLRVGRGTG